MFGNTKTFMQISFKWLHSLGMQCVGFVNSVGISSLGGSECRPSKASGFVRAIHGAYSPLIRVFLPRDRILSCCVLCWPIAFVFLIGPGQKGRGTIVMHRMH